MDTQSLSRLRPVAITLALACLVVRLVVDDDEIAAELAYIAAPALSVGFLLWRSLHSPRGHATAWPILTAGVALLLLAEISWFVDDLREIERYPSWGEYLNAAAILAIGVGLWRTVQRVAPVGDRTGVIDSTAVALAVATLSWLLIVEPSSHEDMDAVEQGWMIGLLALDIGLLAILTRLGLSLRVRPPAYLFIYLAAGGLVAVDGGESMLEISADVDLGVASDLMMMAAYSCWGLAALRSDQVTRTAASALRYVGARRILVLGSSALVPLAALTLQQLRGIELTERAWLVVGLAGMAIGALVMVRMAGLVTTVRQVADASGRERFAAMVEHSSDVILTLDRESSITYCSPAMASVWGHEPQSLMGQPYRNLVPEARVDEASSQIQRVAALPREATLRFDSELRRADGVARDCECVFANLLGHPAVGAIVVTLRDTTDRRALEAQLRARAFRDELTGLANRALFLDRLQHALDRRSDAEGDVVVLFIDLDAFKQVNDGLGHAAGDELLQAVAARLEQITRAGDTVARLGGDEFAILLENRNGLPGAMQAAERVLDSFETPLNTGGLELHLGASVGVAIARDGDGAEPLIQHADIAMYEAKGSRSTSLAIFDPEMKTAAAERIALRSDLERAVDEKQFHLVYQPIVELRSGRIKGAEALIRWTHPERGPVGPDQFIPIAEQTGLIGSIGEWVLEQACQDAALWQDEGRVVTVNVNVSAVQLQDARLVDRVSAAMTRASLDPSRLILEVTETAMMADPEGIAAVLDSLRDLGVGIAIDDFGTGYCSLVYLKRFAFDILKVDRAFVSEVKRDSERLLAHSILALAGNLGVATVAEGIEEEDQLLNLREHGCVYGQGWHLGRPMDRDAFAGFLEGER